MNIIVLIVCILLYYLIYISKFKTKIFRKAIAVFNDEKNKINGYVEFIENLQEDTVSIDINLTGLNPNAKHGFHIHESGDLTKKCESLCAHFNPYKKHHGDITSEERHAGDLGNLQTDSKGNVKYKIVDKIIKLRGIANIIGRGLIIHADEDDCGKGNNKASLINGNAGKRIACAIIGYGQTNFL